MSLRSDLEPGQPDPETVSALSRVIDALVVALDTGAPTTDLMAKHNAISGRTDIPADRYKRLYASMDSEEAAFEALCPKPRTVADISRQDLEEIARRVLDERLMDYQDYYLALFELNTPSGTSDLFFWPDQDWLKMLGTDQPSPAQIVDRAMHDKTIRL